MPTKKKEKQPDLTKVYRREANPFDIHDQEFRVRLIRDDDPAPLVIDGIVESLEWRYEPGNPVMLGTVTMRRDEVSGNVRVRDGHVLQLQYRTGKRWRELWRLRLYDGERTIQGEMTWELADDGRILQESTDRWHFTKSKKRGKPKGWKTHEIVREVARRYRIPLGKIAEGTHYITDISGELTPMQVIQRAYAIEKRATGRRFVVRWQDGKLNVLPLRRNPLLYRLAEQIQDAAIVREERSDKFATAVTVRATKKGGGRSRDKIVVRHINEKAVKKDGFIHREIGGADVKDRADAVRKAKRYIARHSKRKRMLSGVQHPGIAPLRRGDAIQVYLPDDGFKGKKSICFISSGTWSLAGGVFDMSLDLTFDDPYHTAKDRQDKKDKDKRAEKRKNAGA